MLTSYYRNVTKRLTNLILLSFICNTPAISISYAFVAARLLELRNTHLPAPVVIGAF